MRRFFSWKRFSRERPYSGGIHWRAAWLFSLFSLGFTALYLRVGYLADSPGLAQTARQQAKYTLTVSETRGNIYDRELRLLVNKKTETVYGILPSAENLSPVLSAVPIARRAAVSEQLRSGRPFLLKDVSLSETLGVTAFSVPVRSGERQLAPHIVGYTDSDGKGVTGIEKSCDGFLSAASVKQTITYTLDGLGHSIPGIEPEIRSETGNGAGIVLSIDSIIQKVIENAGSAGLKKGAIVVMDPDTGEIRAAASFPFYTRSTLTQCLKDNENTPMINRAFLSYSVGSTFKVVTAAAALEEGISLTESYNCTGQIDVGGQIFRCHKRSGHGEVDMVDGMMKSCNPYFIQLGQLAGGEKLLKMAERFGFGDRVTLSEGMTVSGGTLPTLSQLQSPAAVANLSFGQGALSASPVQICRMMAAVVNGGKLVTPKLVLGTTSDGRTLTRSPDTPAVQILSEGIAAQLQSFLIHCVMVEEGQNALPKNGTAGGKTATAQTGRFREDGTEREHGWFAGFFPAVNPRYVITVLAEDAGFGNKTAAPVFAAITEQLLELGY